MASIPFLRFRYALAFPARACFVLEKVSENELKQEYIEWNTRERGYYKKLQ